MASETANIPRNKRWAAVSASGNADVAYHLFLKEKPNPYEFVCICRVPGAEEDEDDEEEEEEDSENENDEPATDCDAGESCMCRKPAADHPDHRWTISRAGMQRLNTYQDMLNLRNPDAFDMYTFNDHAGYGAIEVAQNMLLDFHEAAGNWKEQWAICEALALLFNTDSLDPMVGIDDGDLFGETMIILELMFLSMLAELEKQGQLAHVRNLGWVMGMVAREADAMRSDGFIEAPEGMKKKKKKAYAGEHFVPYLLVYGAKHNITMYGPSNIADIIAEAEEEAEEQNVELPAAAQDPWGWATGFKAYERKNKATAYGAGSRSKAAIGGDSLDITTYSPAERKAQSFNKKDPLTKDMIKALKDGMCLSIG